MIDILIVTRTPGMELGQEIEVYFELKMFNFQGIERLMLTKFASLMYLWMNDTLMETYSPRGGVKK